MNHNLLTNVLEDACDTLNDIDRTEACFKSSSYIVFNLKSIANTDLGVK